MKLTTKVRWKIVWLLSLRRGKIALRHLAHAGRYCDCGYGLTALIRQTLRLAEEGLQVQLAGPRLGLLWLIERECRGCICHKADLEKTGCECYQRANAAMGAMRRLIFGTPDYQRIAQLLAKAKFQGCFESLIHWQPNLGVEPPRPYWVRSVWPINLLTGQRLEIRS